jgi:hypothetical protein
MIEAVTVNAISTIMLMRAIETMYPGKRLIHLFLFLMRLAGECTGFFAHWKLGRTGSFA